MTRPSRQERGYDAAHNRLRGLWKHRIKQGGVTCWRCGDPITPNEPWDLGHDDHDRSKHRGPEHAARCNRSAAGRKSAEQRAKYKRPPERHPGLL